VDLYCRENINCHINYLSSTDMTYACVKLELLQQNERGMLCYRPTVCRVISAATDLPTAVRSYITLNNMQFPGGVARNHMSLSRHLLCEIYCTYRSGRGSYLRLKRAKTGNSFPVQLLVRNCARNLVFKLPNMENTKA
jgi:hypothetical protein